MGHQENNGGENVSAENARKALEEIKSVFSLISHEGPMGEYVKKMDRKIQILAQRISAFIDAHDTETHHTPKV